MAFSNSEKNPNLSDQYHLFVRNTDGCKKKKFRSYKEEIVHLPECGLSVCPPFPLLPPDRNGELYPAFPVVFMDASHPE